jgi:hypothetical protein
MYDDIIREMKERIEQKEQKYVEWKTKRQQELMDLAREVDLKMDRRRNRKSNLRSG